LTTMAAEMERISMQLVCCRVLQCVAVCCSVLQCVAEMERNPM